VVSSSLPGRRTTTTCHWHARGPRATSPTSREPRKSTYCARGRQIAQRAERGAPPLHPIRGKDHSDAVVSPSRLSSAARAGPRGRILVRSIARSVVRVQALVSVCSGQMAAPYGGQRGRNTALPAHSRYGEGPATRSRPIRIKPLRVSLLAPA
jgi:hypothetical protein